MSSVDRRILCFGDSNTWGVDYENDCRLGKHERWTGILQDKLGSDFTVVEEGLGGRTTVRDDPYEPHRNGLKHLPACLISHDPLDLVVVMLGTNDLKRRFATSAEDIARGLGLICDEIRCASIESPLEILLVAPAAFGDVVEPVEMWSYGIQESRRLGGVVKKLSSELQVHFFDASSVCSLDHSDGIHLNRKNNMDLAEALHQFIVNQVFSDKS